MIHRAIMSTPPDLQSLVNECGGYSRITSEQWAKYDEQLSAVHAWLRLHHKPIPTRLQCVKQ
jgi:hypothetical protein